MSSGEVFIRACEDGVEGVRVAPGDFMPDEVAGSGGAREDDEDHTHIASPRRQAPGVRPTFLARGRSVLG